jgi:hypothetical protein
MAELGVGGTRDRGSAWKVSAHVGKTKFGFRGDAGDLLPDLVEGAEDPLRWIEMAVSRLTGSELVSGRAAGLDLSSLGFSGLGFSDDLGSGGDGFSLVVCGWASGVCFPWSFALLSLADTAPAEAAAAAGTALGSGTPPSSSSMFMISIPFSSLLFPSVMFLTTNDLEEKNDVQPDVFEDIVDSIGLVRSLAGLGEVTSIVGAEATASRSRANASSFTISDCVMVVFPSASNPFDPSAFPLAASFADDHVQGTYQVALP